MPKFINFFPILALLIIYMSQPILAQDKSKGRKQFSEIETLSRLLQIAIEAGYTQEELKQLNLVEDQKVTNVMEYLKKQLEKKQSAELIIKHIRQKKFLTVQDILQDEYFNKKNLDTLREVLITRQETP